MLLSDQQFSLLHDAFMVHVLKLGVYSTDIVVKSDPSVVGMIVEKALVLDSV